MRFAERSAGGRLDREKRLIRPRLAGPTCRDCPWKVSRRGMAFAPEVQQLIHRRRFDVAPCGPACVSAIAPARGPGSCFEQDPMEAAEDEGSNPSGSTSSLPSVKG